VSGREVIIRADDPSVKGGAWYPLTVKKIVRARHRDRKPAAGDPSLRQRRRLPASSRRSSSPTAIHGRPHLPEPVDPLEDGRPAIVALVMGHCTAGGAYIPALSDYS
jgi:3-methylcrotonyl-CoA carboxylase beta subunit